MTLGQAIGELKSLSGSSVAQLRKAAAQGRCDGRVEGNSHVHLPPNFSAFDRAEQAVALAAQEKLGYLGVSNYYDFGVYGPFMRAAREAGIFPLMGLEIVCRLDVDVKINDPGNPGKMYFCGKGITKVDPLSGRAAKLMCRIRRNDDARMAEMTERLGRHFAGHGVELPLGVEEIVAGIVARHGCPAETVTLQERHVAMAFQQAFFEAVEPEKRAAALADVFGTASKAGPEGAVAVQNEIRSHLMKAGKPCFAPESFVTYEEARELILELGGIPCYPVLADGVTPMCPFESPVEQLVANLRERGIYCAELIPLRNKAEVLREYATSLRQAGIVVTAGTEHNTLDLVAMKPACVGGEAVPDDVAEIFDEGAKVVAAHQVLTLHGEVGYTDAKGELNGAYDSQEARIAAMRSIGGAAICSYREKAGR